MRIAADDYKIGDTVREYPSREDFTVIKDGVDNCGQIGLRDKNGYVCFYTPKPGRYRRIRRATPK